MGQTRGVPASERPAPPAPIGAELARVDADLAAARLRQERLQRDLAMSPYVAGCRQPARLAVKLADVGVTIAELEARREELAGAPADPPPAPPNGTAPAPSST